MEALAEKFSGGIISAQNKQSGSLDENDGVEHNRIVPSIRKKYNKELAVPSDRVQQVYVV